MQDVESSHAFPIREHMNSLLLVSSQDEIVVVLYIILDICLVLRQTPLGTFMSFDKVMPGRVWTMEEHWPPVVEQVGEVCGKKPCLLEATRRRVVVETHAPNGLADLVQSARDVGIVAIKKYRAVEAAYFSERVCANGAIPRVAHVAHHPIGGQGKPPDEIQEPGGVSRDLMAVIAVRAAQKDEFRVV